MSVLSRLDDCGLIARAAVDDEEDERDSESLRPHKSAPLLSEIDSAHRAGTTERAHHEHVPRVANQL